MKKAILILLAGATLLGAQAWPDHVATDSDLFIASDNVKTLLSSSVSNSDTSITVDDGSLFDPWNIVTIDLEQIKICAVNGNVLTVCSGGRGFAGTTAAPHLAKSQVRVLVSATYHNTMKTEVQSVESWLWDNWLNWLKVYNVVKYGAHGDGQGDNSTAFAAAITAANVNGGIVYAPCGTYAFTQPITFNSQKTSFWGETEHCAVLTWTPTTGTFMNVVDLPPTGGPHGEFKNFTIQMPNATNGSIAMLSSTSNTLYQNIQVTGCKAATGFFVSNGAIDNNTSNVAFEEKNTWLNVNDDHCGTGWEIGNTGGNPPTNNFIQYNYFDNISGSASLGQTVFKIDAGPIVFHNYVNLACKLDNSDGTSLSPTSPAACVTSSGNWKYGTFFPNGEWNNSIGSGTGLPYAIRVFSGALFQNALAFSNVFAIPGLGGAAVPIDNQAGATALTGFQIGVAGGGPGWSTGSGAPTGSCSNGSLYTRTDTGALYVCQASAWVAK